jgi:hypothetical protein
MKSCPSCQRTYIDDTFTFCLDDGALLSASYNPQLTLQMPAARDTDQPRTDTLGAPSPPGSLPASPPATAAPFIRQQVPFAEALPQRRAGATSKVALGVIVFLAAAVLVLGYIVWRNNQSAAPEVSKANANVQANSAAITPPAQTNNGVNVNAGAGETTQPARGSSSQWLEGVWEGRGLQKTPRMTWSIKLTAESNRYTIEYPSLRCGGTWTLVEMGDGRAKFKETISRGLDTCSNGGDILIEKISDSQISYKYTLPAIGEVASATLSKAAVR